MRPYVHAGAVEVAEKGLPGFVLAVDEVQGRGQELLVHRLHALSGQWTGVLDFAVRRDFEDAARAEALLERRVFGIIDVFGFLFGIGLLST